MNKKRRATILLFHATLSERHRLLLGSLKSAGWEISVFAWNRPGNTSVPKRFMEVVDHWQWIPVKASVWGDISIVARLPLFYHYLSKCIRASSAPDLWIVNHLFMLFLVPFLRGKKIYEVSEMYALDISFHLGALHRLVRPIVSFLEGILVSRVDGVLTIDSRNQWLENSYRKWNPCVQVLWNVPSKCDDALNEEIDNLKEHYKGKKVVAFVGGLKAKKGFMVAIRAARAVQQKHPDVLFLFIGPIKESGDLIQELIQSNDVEKVVRILKPMAYRELLAHLNHACVGLALHQKGSIFPYVSAGNGRKFFTYMQAGIPIIGPSFGEVSKAARMADCVLIVDTQNIDDVSTAIIRLLDRPYMASKMGNNGRKAFIEKFNWKIEEKKLLSFIRKTTGY